jgi:hypothetical protein
VTEEEHQANRRTEFKVTKYKKVNSSEDDFDETDRFFSGSGDEG